jgi:hypothetical protein
VNDDRRPPESGGPPPAARSPQDPIGELAANLGRLARDAPEELKRHVATLSVREQAELALRLPAPQRLELLLHAPKPMRLVRSLADADLYLTVRGLGATDALPLLSLGSASQIHHLIDLESWRTDRFDAQRAGAWVALLVEAGEPTLRRFLRAADDELLALLFQSWLRIEQIEYEDGAEKHGHGESEAGTERGMMPPDGYYRFSPRLAEHTPAIQRLLRCFCQLQPQRYQRILWSAQWELPSELEEQALHWRQSRLEEHGFPSRESALEVYAPPAGTRAHPEPPAPADPDGLAASRGPLMELDRGQPLVPAIESMPAELRERVLFETVSLANHLLVADGADTGEPVAHRRAMEKAAGYLNVALTARGAAGSREVARLLADGPVVELFREGYARATELARRARELVETAWAAAHPDALTLLDEPIESRMRALLEIRPLYVPLRGTDAGEPRDFRSVSEIHETRAALEMAEVVGDLLVGALGLDVARALDEAERSAAEPPRLGAFLMTAMAWHATRGELRGDPLPQAVLADFLRSVASRRTASTDAGERALEMLVRRLAARAGLEASRVALLQGFGRFALEKLAAECSALDPGIPVDPRYIGALLVESGQGAELESDSEE